MKQIEAKIQGQSYTLACPDDEEASMLEAVAMVDAQMSRIRDAGKTRARERMAVVAALNIAHQSLQRTPEVASAFGAASAPERAGEGHAAESDDSALVAQMIARIDQALLGQEGRLF